MTLPLRCACGARLEIDIKFAGQTISCPDCNRPLVAPVPAKPPQTTSGLALASFLLALIGAFTIVGTVAAVVCGFLALCQIEHAASPLGGRNLARAGLIMGGLFTLLTVPAFFLMERLGLDRIVPALELAGRLEYGPDLIVHSDGNTTGFTIERPSRAWGKLKADNSPQDDQKQEVLLFDIWDDAQIICLSKWFPDKMAPETCREKGLDLFQNSRLVKIIGRLGQQAATALPAGEIRDLREVNSETDEFYLDLRLGGLERTFLFRVVRDRSRIGVVAGGARKSRFAKLEKQIRDGVESFKIEK